MSDNGVFVAKDECRKNQKTLLLVPWTGRTTIEEKCDAFEEQLMYLTQSRRVVDQEVLLKNVEKCRKQIGPAEDPDNENRPSCEETENVSGRGFWFPKGCNSDT